jgi:hypothetical protein
MIPAGIDGALQPERDTWHRTGLVCHTLMLRLRFAPTYTAVRRETKAADGAGRNRRAGAAGVAL